MRLFIPVIFLLAVAATPADAQAIQVTFSDLQSVVPSEDAGVCKARYGEGYTTTPHSDGAAHHRVSDKGHEIHIKKSELTFVHGIYMMRNEYDVMFKKADVKQTEAFVYATSLSKRSGFTGVFSDGRCKGKVSIVPK